MNGTLNIRRALPALIGAAAVLVALGPGRPVSAEIQTQTSQFQNAETGPGHSGWTGWSEFYRSF